MQPWDHDHFDKSSSKKTWASEYLKLVICCCSIIHKVYNLPETSIPTSIKSSSMTTVAAQALPAYNRALATITKKDDRVEEGAMLLAAQANWGSFLQPAPMAIGLLGQLMIIACAA